MFASLWAAAALGVLGIPALLATFFFGAVFGSALALTRTPRLDAWVERRAWGDAYGFVRTVGPVAILVVVVALAGGAAVAVPATLAWEIWHDTRHAVVAGSVGAGLPVAFYVLRALADRLRRETPP